MESEDQTPFAAFLAGLPHGFGGFGDARIISIAGARPGKGLGNAPRNRERAL